MSNPVLVASDLTARSDRALARARLISDNILLLHVVPGERAGTAARARLERLIADDLGADAASAEILVESGPVPDTVARVASERGCSLIATGIASFDSPKDYVVGTTIDFLVRRASMPVLVVKRRPRDRYRHILAVTDFSSCSRAAVEAAAALFPDARIRLVHAFGPPFEVWLDPAETVPYMRKQAEASMRALLENLLPPLRERVDTEVAQGQLFNVIERHRAEGRCDLLALGTHGRGALAHAAIGSCASELLASSLADVLMVREVRRPA